MASFEGTGILPGIAEKARHMAGITNWVHPAVALLPPASGSSVSCREEGPDGEIQHQCELSFPEQSVSQNFSLAETAGLTIAKRKPPPFAAPENQGLVYSKEQLKEWGYPTYDAKYDDPNWLSQQFQREYADPRENPNFFLNHEDPEFWNNAARKPHMKALLQSDDHWKLRRNTWLEQYQQVKESNDFRREIADSLEECSMGTRRLLAPILHCRPVESHLMNVLGQAKEREVPFPQLVESPENQRILMDFRNTFDHEGEAGIYRIFQDWHNREIKQSETSKQIVKAESSMKEVHDGLSFATKYRKDGLVEWEKGNHEDALKAWRLGCDALERIRVPHTHWSEQKFFNDVKLALLKNRALAALKLNSWQEALDSSEQVLKLDDEDHKAWFRKACALEGLGRLKEVEACLAMIDGIAVGRADRDRLERETSAKREKVKALISKDEASQQRMLQLGLQQGLFSEDRKDVVKNSLAIEAPPTVDVKAERKPQLDDSTRKRLTKEGAEDMLKELESVYSESNFREQVRKLARDVHDKDEFTCYLARVALPVQKPVLEHWGFEATELGVIEMQCAIEDHSDCDSLKRQADATERALFGEMYNAVKGSKSTAYPSLPEKERLKQAEKRLQRRLKRDDSLSDDAAPRDIVSDASRLYAHWRPVQSKEAGAKERPAEAAAEPPGPTAPSSEVAPGVASSQPVARKEIWAELSKAQKSSDARRLRSALEKASQAGFSAVTIRSAKQALLKLGGNVDGL